MSNFPQLVRSILKGEAPAIEHAVAQRVSGWRNTVKELHVIEAKLAAKGFVPAAVHDELLGSALVMDITLKGLEVPVEVGKRGGGLHSIATHSSCSYLPHAKLTPEIQSDIKAWRDLKVPLVENLEQFASADHHLVRDAAEELAHADFSKCSDMRKNIQRNVLTDANAMFNSLHKENHEVVTTKVTDMLKTIQRKSPRLNNLEVVRNM